jgi:hypothetical protein
MSKLELENNALDNSANGKRRVPQVHSLKPHQLFQNWKRTVPKTMGWIDQDVET